LWLANILPFRNLFLGAKSIVEEFNNRPNPENAESIWSEHPNKLNSLPETLVDHAEEIWSMLATDKTQQQVADEIGWTRTKVANYAALYSISPKAWQDIVTKFQKALTKTNNDGVTTFVTGVTITENLLRNILSLTEHHQNKIISELVSGKIKPAQVKHLSTTYAERESLAEHAIELLICRDDVLDWIDSNSIGRRNLTPDQMSLIRGRRYNRLKNAQGGDHKSKDQNDTLVNSAETLAKELCIDTQLSTIAGTDKHQPVTQNLINLDLPSNLIFFVGRALPFLEIMVVTGESPFGLSDLSIALFTVLMLTVPSASAIAASVIPSFSLLLFLLNFR
jgi:hypothetical protein